MDSSNTASYCLKRSHFDYSIDGWIDDQLETDTPVSIARYNMDDSPESATRSTSPSKRQKILDRTTTATSRWSERVSALDDSASFKEPSSATSASRPGSPSKSIRSRRIQLDYTDPPIFFGPPRRQLSDSEDASSSSSSSSSQIIDPQISQHVNMTTLEHTEREVSIPPDICNLIKRLSEEAANPVLPADIVSSINAISPTEFFELHCASAAPSTNTSRKLLKHISTLFGMARDLYAESYDEAAWYPLVRMLLVGPPGTSSQPFIKHEEAHTRAVCSDLLPRKNGNPIPTVKVDHMLQFNTSHKQISSILKPVFQTQPQSFSLSAFNDPVACKTFTCAVVEAKAPGGNFQEASYQIAIASAAILERIRLLSGNSSNAGDDQDHMPVLGWIVHGHFWTLHVSYREVDGSIRVLGPYPSGNTATYLGIYRLVRIIQEVGRWGKELYFPYLVTKLSCWQ
ncbi:uncharacterized protein RSE6_13543 [Rhynchosporium secalis]|uniref:PD-(D/E)XK nuclease-like domain-containing protein n=1 Tax=Rhynchosporium secalis TaxID=38038 RepID=A0A1E1MT35_RHYSE|nr:uncharacterized protein RSE6_13543 [Rhynchosporium secalis]